MKQADALNDIRDAINVHAETTLETLSPSDNLSGLGLDALSYVEVTMSLEEKWGISIGADLPDFEDDLTVQSLLDQAPKG
ncbi:phosphopantetheine-binding protein [Luteibacter aegosomatissinici]|uniref:phosphopantetheine-binding protein n=1 Tax=Luteibacter aegosomatissinici TaxID=2911539 RepID=UPI001FF732F4|nr:phosphopantetheine-binding protein [Luteibacter aegosomatissinici]UPG93840.1 phosphopantetheine-binding protein [Luteibacter aegosomatissinici]